MTPVTILEVNQRTELLYGYKAVELVGKPAEQLVLEDALQVPRVKIGQGQMLDFSQLLQLSQVLQGCLVLFIFIIPPMELQKIERFGIHPAQ